MQSQMEQSDSSFSMKRAIYHKIIHNPFKKRSQVLPGNITGSIACFSQKSTFIYKLFSFPLQKKRKMIENFKARFFRKSNYLNNCDFGKEMSLIEFLLYRSYSRCHDLACRCLCVSRNQLQQLLGSLCQIPRLAVTVPHLAIQG